MRIIINADDFGRDEETNRAIALCFSKGYITNTTLMVNRAAADHAKQLAFAGGFGNSVGLHINIIGGPPLSSKMSIDTVFVQKGCMTSKRFYSPRNWVYRFWLPRLTREAVRQECYIQASKFIAMDFCERHFDSHGHTHTSPSILNCISRELKSLGFFSCRIANNTKPGFVRKVLRRIEGYLIKRNFFSTSFFGDGYDFLRFVQRHPNCLTNRKYSRAVFEVMVHPVMGEDGMPHNKNGPNLDDIIGVAKKGQMISYHELHKEYY